MRYLPLTPADRAEMLATIGVGSVDDLFSDVPEAARRRDLFDPRCTRASLRWSGNSPDWRP